MHVRDVVPLFLERWCPSHSDCDCRLVILALNRELRAALIETEHFVGQVQTIGDQREPVPQAETALRIELRMRIEVNVPVGPMNSEWGTVLEVVLEYVRTIVADTDTQRQPATVVSRTYIPGIWSLTQ